MLLMVISRRLLYPGSAVLSLPNCAHPFLSILQFNLDAAYRACLLSPGCSAFGFSA
jgi:hypothetical protein